jgi:23S rRNA (guanine745-N1)-methyltransferase
VPWWCPVCHAGLAPAEGGTRWACPDGHSFDRARQGYLNLLLSGTGRSRRPGDDSGMVDARRRFLSTGAYDRVGDALARVAGRAVVEAHERRGGPVSVVDVGCGEGHHTRRVAAALATADDPLDVRVAGIDVSKRAVAIAARSHPSGSYAVASAADIPLPPGAADVVIDVFGPMFAAELARVVPPGGTIAAVHPGPRHLRSLRALVYDDARPHDVKEPLRAAGEWFTRTGAVTVMFPIVLGEEVVVDLFTMTPYRWHGPPGVDDRLRQAARPSGFADEVDVIITTYRRRWTPG